MNVLLLLIPLGLGLLALALGFFLWAVRNGQLENLDHEGSRILFDDDTPPEQIADTKRETHRERVTDTKREAPQEQLTDTKRETTDESKEPS